MKTTNERRKPVFYGFVYALFKDHELLYIGSTKNPLSRKRSHVSTSRHLGWNRFEILSRHWTRMAAFQAEANAISRLQPPFNVNNKGAPPDESMDSAAL